MSDDKVIDFDDATAAFFRGLDKPAEAAATPPVPATPPEPEAAVSLDQLSPLPQPGDPYDAARSRLSNGPLATIFFIPKSGLPDGIEYAALHRLRMIEPEKPGGSPALLLRFRGDTPIEVLIEGRSLFALLDYIGRHLIHWLREHPTGLDDGSLPVFIHRITVKEVKT